MKLYMFQAYTVPIIRSYQLHTWQLVCFTQVVWPLPRRVRLEPDSPRHETYQLSHVQLTTPDDGHSRCPKHVKFCDKIKFWILDAFCWLFIRRFPRFSSLEHLNHVLSHRLHPLIKVSECYGIITAYDHCLAY
jgi:hypothetical protein